MLFRPLTVLSGSQENRLVWVTKLEINYQFAIDHYEWSLVNFYIGVILKD